MRAAVLHGPGDLRIDDVDEGAPRPGEVVLGIRAATTCGTDVKMLRRGHRVLGPYPARFGHEFAGEILAIGAGVTGWKVGDAVFCADSAPCGRCPPCRADRAALCQDLLFLMGGFAERLRVPARVVTTNLHRLPPHVPMGRAPMAEPLACVVRAVDGAGVPPGDDVVVVGGGSIGLLLCAVVTLAGARCIVVDPHEDRLALAARLGAVDVVSATRGASDVGTVAGLTGGGAAHVFEAVGRPAAWESAIAMARPGGVVTFVGGCAADDHVRVPASRVHYEEVTLRGSFHHTPHHIARALALLGDQRVEWDALIGPSVGLGDLAPMLEHGPSCTGHPKQLVTP
jgi:L-iditol 2-dehydrogenase